ncbi:ATP-binding protein [Telluria beijingensis]|uniref:ATP-binding protein n=1 Tax=Telluria beijingensis TaxID=3068633 RepID=UPI0027953DF0|nr:winged helix-turn-helix domain-containing protein [Massilia sp. REN29]
MHNDTVLLPTQAGADYTFGPFALYPARKLLVRGETPVALGGRAFDLLVALVTRAGEVVSHHELVEAVWPHAVVEENGLRVHMSALRKALGESAAERYVATVPGRGYRFVTPVRACPWDPAPHARGDWPPVFQGMRGPRLGQLVGRSAALLSLEQGLAQASVATVTGAGGCGKSALALAHARRHPGCHVVDCAAGEDPVAAVGDLAHARQALLVLDNCEHDLPAAARAAQIAAATDGLTLLATSRAPLGVAGEWVLRLPPLDLPAPGAALDCAQALALPAIALFVERAAANSSRFALNPANLPYVIELCRQLDGLPLALELAAARVEALGVEGLAARLDDIFVLLTRSRRLAGPRHASLAAVFEASDRLLDEAQRTLLRRLALFDGAFAPAVALQVCAFGALAPDAVAPALAALAAGSLLETDGGGPAYYRLLNTTRRYVRARLAASGEAGAVAQRMEHYRIEQS